MSSQTQNFEIVQNGAFLSSERGKVRLIEIVENERFVYFLNEQSLCLSQLVWSVIFP